MSGALKTPRGDEDVPSVVEEFTAAKTEEIAELEELTSTPPNAVTSVSTATSPAATTTTTSTTSWVSPQRNGSFANVESPVMTRSAPKPPIKAPRVQQQQQQLTSRSPPLQEAPIPPAKVSRFLKARYIFLKASFFFTARSSSSTFEGKRQLMPCLLGF